MDIYVQTTLCPSTSKLAKPLGLSSHAADPAGIQEMCFFLEIALGQQE